MGIALLAAATSAMSGSSTAVRFNFFGVFRLLVKRDARSEAGRLDRWDERRESGFLVR